MVLASSARRHEMLRTQSIDDYTVCPQMFPIDNPSTECSSILHMQCSPAFEIRLSNDSLSAKVHVYSSHDLDSLYPARDQQAFYHRLLYVVPFAHLVSVATTIKLPSHHDHPTLIAKCQATWRSKLMLARWASQVLEPSPHSSAPCRQTTCSQWP